jgi:hypothetical protein
MASEITLNEIIDMLWVHPENTEWKPKTDTIPGTDFRRRMASDDMEVLDYTYHLLGDHRFYVEPELSLDEYLEFVRRYYERCFLESPDGDWSDSRYSAGWDLVSVLAFQWNNPGVPKSVMEDWKQWLANIYKRGSDDVRKCIVTATLEHLLEQGVFRQFFADWVKDPILRKAYEEALEWYEGGGRTPLGKSSDVAPFVRSQLEKSRFRKR